MADPTEADRKAQFDLIREKWAKRRDTHAEDIRRNAFLRLPLGDVVADVEFLCDLADDLRSGKIAGAKKLDRPPSRAWYDRFRQVIARYAELKGGSYQDFEANRRVPMAAGVVAQEVWFLVLSVEAMRAGRRPPVETPLPGPADEPVLSEDDEFLEELAEA